jgi:hypothetical protein
MSVMSRSRHLADHVDRRRAKSAGVTSGTPTTHGGLPSVWPLASARASPLPSQAWGSALGRLAGATGRARPPLVWRGLDLYPSDLDGGLSAGLGPKCPPDQPPAAGALRRGPCHQGGAGRPPRALVGLLRERGYALVPATGRVIRLPPGAGARGGCVCPSAGPAVWHLARRPGTPPAHRDLAGYQGRNLG